MSKQQDQYLEALQRRRKEQAASESPPTPESPPDAGTPGETREGETGGSLADTLRALQVRKRRTWR
jgi:hypothetical protein